MDISEQKTTARKAAYARRKAAHQSAGDAARQAADRVLALLEGRENAAVAAYMPIRTEIDALPLMEALHAAGHRVCVPVIDGEGLPLRFKHWTPACEMEEGPFGAAIPADGAFFDPDVLIVPLVAFDPEGFRLGYGGGFYDRSLELLRAKKPVLAIGYAYAAQEAPQVPRESTDQRLDAIVTEKATLTF